MIMKLLNSILRKKNIVVFSDVRYSDVLENWLSFFPKDLYNSLNIVALDHALSEKDFIKDLIKKKVKVSYLDWSGDLNELWVKRVEYLHALVANGYSVIHSDIDAIWLKNPINYLDSLNSDILFSQGTIWPQDCYEKHGLVLCCGFFYIKSGNISEQFMARWLDEVKSDPDDQRSLNRLLHHVGYNWSENVPEYTLKYLDKKISCFKDAIYSSGSVWKSICLLPQSKFQRIPENNCSPYIVHPLSNKSGSSVQEILKNLDLWRI